MNTETKTFYPQQMSEQDRSGYAAMRLTEEEFEVIARAE